MEPNNDHGATGPTEGRIKSNGNLRPWKPGQSGNPAGRPKGPTISERLRVLVMEAEGGKFLEAFVKAGMDAALGDPENNIPADFRFWNAIFERIDGKVIRRVHAADAGGTIFVGVTSNGRTPDRSRMGGTGPI